MKMILLSPLSASHSSPSLRADITPQNLKLSPAAEQVLPEVQNVLDRNPTKLR
ncbi:MAG: hypothetical protein HKK67_04555 [Chlorobiaceae bacterium]|nr:hypothetical protein [Chlorobiaceae bacterium]